MAYNTIFGDPHPMDDGLASYDVTDMEIDVLMAAYTHHRQALVDLGALSHMSADFPRLVSDGNEEKSAARSVFIDRLSDEFSGHKHYSLAADGSFDAWVPADDRSRWENFVEAESERFNAKESGHEPK